MAEDKETWTPLAATAPTPKKRAVDKLSLLKKDVELEPWHVDAWLAYVAEAQKSGDVNVIRVAFDLILAQFPTATKHWIAYIELELAERAFDKVEALFNRCLRSIVSVDIWKFYLTYIQNVHSPAIVPPDKRAESRQIVLKAFDLVLSNVGLDKDSGSIWLDYLAYIRTAEGLSKYEEQQMMDLQRKVYHKALSIPLSNIEAIWREYDIFENSLHKLTAKKFLTERSPAYMTARAAFRELKIITAAIDSLQSSWLPTPTTWTETDFELLRAWKKLISWEKSNPLRIEDPSILSSRVIYAYKSALLMMRFFPELWHDAARYLIELGKLEEAGTLLEQAVEALPRSLLLSFAFAELQESCKKENSAVAGIYESLITNLESWVTEINKKYDAEHENLMILLRGSEPVVDMTDWDGERREAERDKERERNAQVEQKVEVARKRKLLQVKEAWSLVWVVYMRSTRRSQSVLAARNLFKRARKSELCLYHVYVAAAQMEYYSSKDVKIACNIFEAGMKAFAEDASIAGFIVHYIDFLIQMNDDNNARALFERALVLLPPENCRDIWAHFFKNEVENGDLSNILKVEKRMRDAYPGDVDSSVGVKNLGDRWSFLGIQFVAREELGIKDFVLPTKDFKQPSSSSTTTPAETKNFFQTPQDLDPIYKDAFSQPDLTKWALYKPEAKEKPLLAEKVLLPGVPLADVQPVVGALPQRTSHHQKHSHQQQQPSVPATVSFMIAESISQLLDRLPPASSYNGPQLPLDLIVDGLKGLPLPTPVSTGRMVLYPQAAEADRGARYDDRDRDRGGRGRSRHGGGGGGAAKRKGGYGSDEERYRKR
ncbi:UNVERIFIED_CONTAM: mRNA 3'-end-processing protein rna14 [Siphonaria sp. JEL0065]|nr:mRNA 3'-end-processing protein rna14 [Siphonaria sp. JEL0065]